MEFRILGPLEITHGGAPLTLPGAKQRALLALLLLNANDVVSSDRLIEELYEGRPSDKALSALHVQISGLRKVLEPQHSARAGDSILVTKPPGYMLRTQPGQVDLERFDTLLANGRAALAAGDPRVASDRLREALSLWHGGALADLAFEPWAQTDIARLEERRLAAIEERIEADLALGRHHELVGELDALVAEHPLRERFRRQLMLALYRSGRHAEALEAYRDARRTLVDELGIEPSRNLQAVERAILVQDPALDPAGPAQTRAAEGTEIPGPAGSSFVGRQRELSEFLVGLEDAFAGRTSLFLIAGEPGIGKSRLADELTARAEERGARVLWGRCWEAGGAPAYWPWVQVLRAHIRESDPEQVRADLAAGASDVAEMLPELHELFPGLSATPSLDPEGARFRLFDSTASFLRAAAGPRPLVLAIDDLHAADTPSLLLLRFLARELRDARVAFVVAYRDSEAGPGGALTATVAELRREPITRVVGLGGLTVREMHRFIELTVGTAPSDGLTAAIHTETEGNPLFAGELVRLLVAEGRLDEAIRTPWRASIPRGVREVIGHRLLQLSDTCKRLLAVGSVLGREFRLDALAALSEQSELELVHVLDEALAARVLGEVPADRTSLRFSHALIRDSLYEDLATAERLRLHRRAAETLEALYGSRGDQHLTELAHHFLEAAPAGDAEKAIDYARRAADRAAALLAYEEAARLYEMALAAVELTAAPDESTRCELLLELGEAQSRGGDLGAAKETFARAADVARTLGAAEQLARAALGYGGRIVWFRAGKDQRLIALLEEALKALPGDTPIRSRLLSRLAGALRDRPVPERRSALTAEAVEIARRVGDRATLAYALEGTYASLSLPRDPDAWLAMARELCELADEADDKEQAYNGHTAAFGAFMVRGEIGMADAELAVMSALGQELRQPAQSMTFATVQGMRAMLAGRFEDAAGAIERVADFGPGGHWAMGVFDQATFHYVLYLQRWALAREVGRLEEVRETIEDFVVEYPTFFIFRCLQASSYSLLGEQERARTELDRLAADDFRGLDLGAEWFFETSLLAEVCGSVGTIGYAAALYDALLPYGDFNAMAHPEFSLGSASRYLGILASTMSLWEEAVAHFERALTMNAAMGARPWVAHTLDDYARMLLARDEPGDRQRTHELIAQAGASYRELGMETWAESASELTQRL
jgi:DNA-binding SARP family transcriptional activator